MFAKVGSSSKGLFDKAWAGLDKYVGEPMNKVAGKLGIEGVWPTTMDRECDKAARILRVFTLDGGLAIDAAELNYQDPDASKKTQKVIKKIPAKAIQEAEGLAIFTVFRTGLGFSAASGSGLVIAKKPDGSWGLPSGLLVHTVGFGFMAGIDVYDVVLILRTRTAVESFANPKLNLGGEVTLVGGPLTASVMADAGYKQAPIWSYVKSKGFYAGVQLDGTIIIERQDENARFYRTKVSAGEILRGNTTIFEPYDVRGLRQTIQAAAGKTDAPTDAIPQGLPPSDVVEKAQLSDVQQPAEGFGAPPSYDNMEVIKVKCSDCGSEMTMEELELHACHMTEVVPSQPEEKRRSVPAVPPQADATTETPTEQKSSSPVENPADAVTDTSAHMEEIRLNDDDELDNTRIEMTIKEDSV